jgi:orotidine-5'-phosphate decarboxylase
MTKQELFENIKRKNTFLCVGLDTDIKKIPKHLLEEEDPIFAFNKAIIDATVDYCVAFKPNLAFYESLGTKGWISFEKTVQYLREYYPDQFLIADAKRGDIGNTSELYARAFFDEMKVDAVTVAPYMGSDSVKPFLYLMDEHKQYTIPRKGTWTILLALTSNEGADDFQLMFDGASDCHHKLYQKVLRKGKSWATDEQLMFVVGATQTGYLVEIRKIVPDYFLLIPGVGAQGGSLEEVCKYGMNSQCGLLVNNSRQIIYASNGKDFAEAAGQEAKKMQLEMEGLLIKYGRIQLCSCSKTKKSKKRPRKKKKNKIANKA